MFSPSLIPVEPRSLPYLQPARPPSETACLYDPRFPYREELLQFIWQYQLFERHALRTIEGRPVEVVRPGRVQMNGGPDLIDAQLRIDGQLWAGPIEVHVAASEWYAHGHHRDPAYDNVVLHVVFENDRQAVTSGGRRLPTLELGARISTDSLVVYDALMKGRSWVPCAAQLDRVEPERIGPWLERVLVERLMRKTVAVEQLFRSLGGDAQATTYHVLVRAFGMKVNADPFSMLAQALPLRTILKYRDDELRTEALLFGQAGLLHVDFLDAHPRRLQVEHGALSHLHALRPAPLAAWRFTRMRPGNFPTVRIAQLAQVLMRLGGSFDPLLMHDELDKVRSAFDVQASAYWNTHYRFDQVAPLRPKFLGRSAADTIIINAVVPILFALSRIQGKAVLRDRAMGLLEQLPAENNAVLDRWARSGLVADSAGRGQALLELKQVYCTPRKCLFCGIGRHLLKRSVPFGK
ncbi:MAG: DUF2851 family protein [Flavobacteriales bacterium]|nr:DUF2851 family protein [Flavobacteriales bacterium]MCB9194399.1 DUF2851 family protein [Flavobacteriales bacterium]